MDCHYLTLDLRSPKVTIISLVDSNYRQAYPYRAYPLLDPSPPPLPLPLVMAMETINARLALPAKPLWRQRVRREVEAKAPPSSFATAEREEVLL